MFGWIMIVTGLAMIVNGLTAEYLYNDTEGPIPDEERELYRATPKRRLMACGLGLFVVAVGAYHLIWL